MVYYFKGEKMKSTKRSILGTGLAQAMKNKGFSQAQLAEKLDVNQRTVSAWEKGVCEPSLATLTQISEFFDETLDTLLY